MVTEPMYYLSEFVGCLIFLLGGYGYMCNISLKKTLVSKLNYIELTVAWSLAVGFALSIALIMGGPACLNPGVVFGQMIWNGMHIGTGALLLLMEFLGAGAAVLLCMIFFRDSLRLRRTRRKGVFSPPIRSRKIFPRTSFRSLSQRSSSCSWCSWELRKWALTRLSAR